MAKKTATRETSKGICDFCKGEFDKSKMSQHLKYCKQRIASMETTKSQEPEKTKLFHLVVEGRDLPMYWMHLEMPADATLSELDDFLRAIWLECCDHLSAFRIGKASYLSQTQDMYWEFDAPNSTAEEESGEEEKEEKEEEADEGELEDLSPVEMVEGLLEVLSDEFQSGLANVPLPELEAKLSELLTTRLGISLTPEMQSQVGNLAHYLQLSSSLFASSPQEQDMDVEFGEVLKVGQKFFHEYDFGSTTDLALRVVAEREGVMPEDEDRDAMLVQVMARNEPPVIPCRACGKPATKVAAGYYYVGDGALCDACAKTNRNEYEDSFLPIVNSPRVGVCGYTGDQEYVYWDEDEDEEYEDEEDEEDAEK